MSPAPTSEGVLSYSIYAAGLTVGTLSPQEWLVYLSIVAVLLRIPIDAKRSWDALKKMFGREKKGEDDDEV